MKGGRIVWSAAELNWISAHRAMFRTDAHRDFCRRFIRPEITFGAYASLCQRMGWLTGRIKGNGTKGRARRFSADETAWIAARQEMTTREAHALFIAQFGRDDVSLDNFKALRTRRGLKTGAQRTDREGQYPGQQGQENAVQRGIGGDAVQARTDAEECEVSRP